MALQATTVQTQYSPFQQVILSTISTNSSYQTIERIAQKQTFTNLFSNAICALSQSSQVFNEDWALFDSHVAVPKNVFKRIYFVSLSE
jgi:hypothetical protein